MGPRRDALNRNGHKFVLRHLPTQCSSTALIHKHIAVFATVLQLHLSNTTLRWISRHATHLITSVFQSGSAAYPSKAGAQSRKVGNIPRPENVGISSLLRQRNSRFLVTLLTKPRTKRTPVLGYPTRKTSPSFNSGSWLPY